MSEKKQRRCSVSLSFEEIRRLPFEDILVLGRNCPYGKFGVSRSCDMLFPNEYKTIDIEDELVGAILINKKILRKLNEESIIETLKENVFPYVSDSGLTKVNFKIKTFFDSIELKVGI